MENTNAASTAELTVEKKFQLLLEISEKISTTLDLDMLLVHLIDTVKSIVDYDAAGIYVIKRQGELRLIEGMVTRGYEDEESKRDLLLKLGEGVVGSVIERGSGVIIPDVIVEPRYVMARKETRSELAVPITLNERVIGAFNLESDTPNKFTEADAEVLHFFANAAAIAIEKAVLHEELVEKKRIESQLEVARQVQASLLPDRPPEAPGFDVAAENLPTYEVGGDYYDFIVLPDGQIGVAIADVSGKGVPAALIMATFRAALRTQVRNDFAIGQIIRKVNYLLWESTADSQFVTAVYGVLDTTSGRFTYTNAGHNPPLLVGIDGSITELNRGGPALGVFDKADYEEAVVDIEVGDVLVLYTDGVIEAADSTGREFGVRRLQQTVTVAKEMSAFKVTRAIMDATRAFSGTEAFTDDFTLAVIKRTGDVTASPVEKV
ncbi:MAG TPA: SpoIIE family protein phosphatase [Blastocatellia bacterium]|nr:SpoIIE family protein phosphatase [Blastocatellia bacterium]